MAGYKSLIVYSKANANATAANVIMTDTIDISNFDKFSLCYKNSSTAAAFIDLQVQVATNPAASASDTADNWVQVPTATLPQPSALGALATVLTGPIENTYNRMRITGRLSVSASIQVLEVQISGFERF